MRDKLFIASYTFVVFIFGVLAGVAMNLQVPKAEPKICPEEIEMEIDRAICTAEKIDLLIKTKVMLTGRPNP